MKPLKKILVALDLTAMDEGIVNYLEQFSKAILPDEITLLHISPEVILPDSYFGSSEDRRKYIDDHIEGIQKTLEDQKEKYFGHRSDLEVRIKVIFGNPLKELLHFYDNYQPDLLVVGRKKISSGSGIVAQKLARRVACSILFITENSLLPIRHIVVPVDYSTYSEGAMQAAISLHPLLGDPEITCLHVYDIPVGISVQIGRTT